MEIEIGDKVRNTNNKQDPIYDYLIGMVGTVVEVEDDFVIVKIDFENGIQSPNFSFDYDEIELVY